MTQLPMYYVIIARLPVWVMVQCIALINNRLRYEYPQYPAYAVFCCIYTVVPAYYFGDISASSANHV